MMAKKKWFIKRNGERQGPYSLGDLKGMKEITPDTLVWKKGFTDWIPVRDVKELQELFEEEEFEKKEEEEEVASLQQEVPGEVAVVAQQNPPFFILWIIIAFLIVLYLLYQLR